MNQPNEKEINPAPKKKAVKKKAVKKQEKFVAQVLPQEITPMTMLNKVIDQGSDIEKMKELFSLQKEWEENESRKAFYDALAKFKANPPTVVKDKLNKQYGSDYASIGNMVNTVNEAMGPFGLTASWEFPKTEKDWIVCTCILSHKLGYSKSVTMDGPLDNSGKKNPLQMRKSSRTYLKLETFEAVTGMVSVTGNIDDDGNESGDAPEDEPPALMPEYPEKFIEQNKQSWIKLINEGKTPEGIIKTVSSKYTLTDEQKQTILDLSQ